MNATRDLIRREIAGVRQRVRGTVVTDPRPESFDTTGNQFPVYVCDVNIGRNRVLAGVPVKLNAAGSRSYARPGSPVWLEKDAGRYQVIGPADRTAALATVLELDEDAGTSASAGSTGFTFQREPFSYYKGTPPSTFYDPAADAAVRVWLRAYDRALGQPSNISVASDSAGAQILSLTDKSGHGNSPAQTTAAERPLYRRFDAAAGNSNALSAADFDGLNDRLVFPAAVTEASPGAISIFVLCDKDGAGSGDDILLELDHWRLYSRRTAGDSWGFDQGGGVIDTGSQLLAQFVLVELVASSFGVVSAYQNGALLGAFTPSGGGLGLGSSRLGGSATLGSHDGRIAEVLVLDGAVSDSKRQTIEAYFNQAMFVPYSRWSNGVDGFPKIRVLDQDGNEVVL